MSRTLPCSPPTDAFLTPLTVMWVFVVRNFSSPSYVPGNFVEAAPVQVPGGTPDEMTVMTSPLPVLKPAIELPGGNRWKLPGDASRLRLAQPADGTVYVNAGPKNSVA